MSGHLELLTHSLISLARGRNIDTVTGTQTISSFLPLKSDLQLGSQALYITELVNQFTVDSVANFPLFELLRDTMHHLCQSDNNKLLMYHFELHLLNDVGYRPQLQHCVSCRQPLEPEINTFSFSSGGAVCSTCSGNYTPARPLSVNALKVLRFLQNSSYTAASKLKLDREICLQLKYILRGYIEYLLERDIKSADWLDRINH
jgi:DNA repair protein RecO (recombination protein O)